MSRKPSAESCPVPGAPCIRVLDDLQCELIRQRARATDRHPEGFRCSICSETNPFAAVGGRRCYGNAVRPVEGDHVRGHGEGPAVWVGPANLNRIAEEGERLWAQVGRTDLCAPCIYGFGLRIGLHIGRLGTHE